MKDESWVWIFPGQGSQEPRMGEFFWNHPDLQSLKKSLLEVAPPALDEFRQKGPETVLSTNLHSSLCIYITSILAARYLNNCGLSPSVTLGFSVGQDATLVAAGALDCSAGLKLLVERAHLMDRESAKESQGMLAVMGLPVKTVQTILDEITREDGRVYISNFNASQRFTVAGLLPDLNLAADLFQKARALRIQSVATTGAWHSPFMQGARADFEKHLAPIMFERPIIPVLSNVTGKPFEWDHLKNDLSLQLDSPVLWHQSIQWCLDQGYRHFIEVGHGNLLSKMLSFIDRKAIVVNATSVTKT